MRKKIISFCIALILIFISCNKDNYNKTICRYHSDYNYLDNCQVVSICLSDTCIKYQTIWKELFLEKNNLNQNYFDKHITLCNSEISEWDEGISFGVCYKIQIDWAVTYNCDQFIIKIKKGNILYPALSLQRDTLLSKENIRSAINFSAFSSYITNVSNIENLQVSSNQDAINKLINAGKVNNLCFNYIYIDRLTGHMILEADAQYLDKNNSCIQGQIDLINGKITITNIPCMID